MGSPRAAVQISGDRSNVGTLHGPKKLKLRAVEAERRGNSKFSRDVAERLNLEEFGLKLAMISKAATPGDRDGASLAHAPNTSDRAREDDDLRSRQQIEYRTSNVVTPSYHLDSLTGLRGRGADRSTEQNHTANRISASRASDSRCEHHHILARLSNNDDNAR